MSRRVILFFLFALASVAGNKLGANYTLSISRPTTLPRTHKAFSSPTFSKASDVRRALDQNTSIPASDPNPDLATCVDDRTVRDTDARVCGNLGLQNDKQYRVVKAPNA